MTYRRGKFFKQTIRVLFERIEKRIINRIQLNGGLVDTENPEISIQLWSVDRDFQGFRSQRTVMRNIFYTTNRKKKELNLRLEETIPQKLKGGEAL
jgi:hypothetical protein